MILHLFDDEKVVSRAVGIFEEATPGENFFIVRTKDSCNKQSLLDLEQKGKLLIYRDEDELDPCIFDRITIVSIHYLDVWKINFINKYLPRIDRIRWHVWGGDMYNDLLVNMGYNIYYEPIYLSDYYRGVILRFLKKIGYVRPHTRKILDFIFNRVTELVTTKEEYVIHKQYLGEKLSSRIIEKPMITYYSIDDMLGKNLVNKTVTGDNIIIGNSSSLSNNHLYVFKILSNLNIGEREILAPLSYGGNLTYRNHIISCGNTYFKNNFKPLTDFLPLPEYNKVMLGASVCLYGNWRQEAVGNILVSLYLGAKVFLSNKSPLLNHYKQMGLFVFCLEEITQDDLDTPLKEDQVQTNREILYNSCNRNAIIEGIREYLK